MLEFIKVIIIGIIQGITEWLPISSTGHMILANEFIKLNVSDDFMNMFLVVIQFGSILAVITLFFHKLNPLSPKKTKDEKNNITGDIEFASQCERVFRKTINFSIYVPKSKKYIQFTPKSELKDYQ